MLRFTIILSILLILFSACERDTVSLEEEDTREPVFYYVGSYFKDTYIGNNRWAMLVINDSIIKLSPGRRSDAQMVYANANDVYVGGYQHNGTEAKKVSYWKNNTITHLSEAEPYNRATAIYENNNNIYVAGTVYQDGKPYQRLWVNGKQKVNSGAMDISGIRAITVANGKYYLAGQFAQSATIWHDNYMRTIETAPSKATYIKVEGEDIITMGYGKLNTETDLAKVWKGNVEIFRHPVDERVSTILGTMSGKDYYFVTYNGSTTPKVFKNNQLLYSLKKADKVRPMRIQVYRNKVYVLGNIIKGTKVVPTLWIDGEPKTLYSEEENIYLNDFFIR